jgi:hypothetical protein
MTNLKHLTIILVTATLAISCERQNRNVQIEQPKVGDVAKKPDGSTQSIGSAVVVISNLPVGSNSGRIQYRFQGKEGSIELQVNETVAIAVINNLPVGSGAFVIVPTVGSKTLNELSQNISISSLITTRVTYKLTSSSGGGNGDDGKGDDGKGKDVSDLIIKPDFGGDVTPPDDSWDGKSNKGNKFWSIEALD